MKKNNAHSESRSGAGSNRLKKTGYFLAGFAGFCLFLWLLLLHRPFGFVQLQTVDSNEVSKYLTHQLLPEFYNGQQSREPFSMAITEEGLNEVIAHMKWPREYGDMIFDVPRLYFMPGKIVIIGKVAFGGVEFVATVAAKPELDEQGDFYPNIEKVKLGAVNITPIAHAAAVSIFRNKFKVDEDKPEAKLVWAIVDGGGVEPVISIDGDKIKLRELNIASGTVNVRFVPVED